MHHLHRSSHAGFLALVPALCSRSSRFEGLFSCLPVQTPCGRQPWLSGVSSLGVWSCECGVRHSCFTGLESIVAVYNTLPLLERPEGKWVCSTNFQPKVDRCMQKQRVSKKEGERKTHSLDSHFTHFSGSRLECSGSRLE